MHDFNAYFRRVFTYYANPVTLLVHNKFLQFMGLIVGIPVKQDKLSPSSPPMTYQEWIQLLLQHSNYYHADCFFELLRHHGFDPVVLNGIFSIVFEKLSIPIPQQMYDASLPLGPPIHVN
jgi:hypothetical protein